ncbi:MAG TPA: GNAT family N-acetyltransferase [Candidatus Acidoferrales bacterium]
MNSESITPAAKAKSKFAGSIRAPRAQDYAALADLAGQLSYPSNANEIALRLAHMEGRDDHAVFVAEMPSGEIAGWIAVFILVSVEVDPRGEISGFVVDERFRSQEVGKHLLARAEEWVRDRGCDTVGLRSNVIRDRAHAFYLRESYQHTKTQKSFRKNLKQKV